MLCLCRRAMDALLDRLQTQMAVPPTFSFGETALGTLHASASLLAVRALPSEPWCPDPAWLEAVPLIPAPRLAAGAVATLTALASLLGQASAAGLDPLRAPQTLGPALESVGLRLAALPPLPDPAPWQALANLAEAAQRIVTAAAAGLLPPSEALVALHAAPGQLPMRRWLALLRSLRSVAPLIALLGVLEPGPLEPAAVPARLAETVRAVLALPVVPFAATPATLRLVALLSATDRLAAVTGLNPLRGSLDALAAALRSLVADALSCLAAVLPRGTVTPVQDTASLGGALGIGAIPYCPTALATPAVFAAATSPAIRTLASLSWTVPAVETIGVLSNTLPNLSILASIGAAFGSPPLRAAGCPICEVAGVASAGADAV